LGTKRNWTICYDSLKMLANSSWNIETGNWSNHQKPIVCQRRCSTLVLGSLPTRIAVTKWNDSSSKSMKEDWEKNFQQKRSSWSRRAIYFQNGLQGMIADGEQKEKTEKRKLENSCKVECQPSSIQSYLEDQWFTLCSFWNSYFEKRAALNIAQGAIFRCFDQRTSLTPWLRQWVD